MAVTTPGRNGARFRLDMSEINGALGDLGTLLPLLLGAVAVGVVAPQAALAGFGLCYIAVAFIYRLPIPVQPMKAIAAFALTAAVTPSELALAGFLTGFVLLVLGLTGWIERLRRLVPQSIIAGLQLGLGLSLALLALNLMGTSPLLALIAAGAMLVVSVTRPAAPAVLILLVVACSGSVFVGTVPGQPETHAFAGAIALPTAAEWERSLTQLVLPQLSLTLTNAIILTALVAGDYFQDRARHVTPRRLCVTSGLANILLCPFGAMPMCHGAGGLAAHHRFGARSGGAPLVIGALLLTLAIVPGGSLVPALVPSAVLGVLIAIAAFELSVSRRLLDSRPSCWPVIAATALATFAFDPFIGLLFGTGAEMLRLILLRRFSGQRG
ncbi:putative sulfate/molybdate transporter [Pararhizobium haloflavum]|uniref:putative sulfate/molybdate transporter n=1 Tax=Pararhizobium haloflavum TaxID=2037914 RepID=UPI0018E45C0C|nr:putative sulfate/molybdate transporter [Pararhizobium haloflavum]